MVEITLKITRSQAKYLKRRLHGWAKQKKAQAKRDNFNYTLSPYFEDYLVCIALEQELSKYD